MFSRVTDASKVALVHLVARLNYGGFRLLDAQFVNPHLERLGAIVLPKARYHEVMEPLLSLEADFFAFDRDDDPEAVLAWAAPVARAPQSATSSSSSLA
jgi:leucyl/phenylalanyl-tRNA--protein transferase